MNIAFCLYKYFPYGGLERDFLRIASVCQERGHTIHVFTMSWEGDMPPTFDVTVMPVKYWTNQGRNRIFADKLRTKLKRGRYDVIVGFNKMPDIDIYYAADPCYVARIEQTKPAIFKLTSRFRHFADYERLVFGPDSKVELMMISEIEKEKFIRFYQTPVDRFHLLPPGINPDRKAPENAAQIRKQWRQEFQLSDNEKVILMVGSAFKRKGLDRALIALAALPEQLRNRTRLIIIGQDNPAPFQKLAKNLGVENRLQVILGRDDIPRFLLGADLFMHPAYSENTGTVILEAIVAGLPVLITAVCGYAFHVKRSKAGLVVAFPFEQQELNKKLKIMLTDCDNGLWSYHGINYGQSEDLYSMPEVAADIIEAVPHRRRMRSEN